MNAESFNLDHRYVSAPYVRIADRKTLPGGDVLVKYDVRFTQPNVARLDTQALHSIEHMTAELMRNHTDKLIDFSPMGCRTGFYALTLGMEPDEFLPILAATCEDILNADEVPAANAIQCGWGAHHSLAGAKAAVRAFLAGRDGWEQVTRDTPYPRDETPLSASNQALVNSDISRPSIDADVDAVLVFAMPDEMAPLFPEGLPEPAAAFGPVTLYPVDVPERRVFAAVSGIGPEAAASAAAVILDRVKPAALLSVGTCGGISGVKVGDLIVGDTYRYGDADASVFGYAPGQVPGQPEFFTAADFLADAARGHEGVHVGQLLSSQSFVSGADAVAKLLNTFPNTLGTDMESTAFAQIANAWHTPFAAVRCVSDLCSGEGGSDEFKENLSDASARAAALAVSLIDHA